MAVPREIQQYLDAQSFDAVEDAWLSRLETHADDVDYFGAVAKALARAGEEDRARVLLEMVDESLSEAENWQARLNLLKTSKTLLFDAKKLHPQILKTLKSLYGHYPSFEELLEKVGLRRAVDDIPKNWKKAERLAGLLAFDVGSIVYLEGQGAGRVTEVNMALESFKVELADQPDIRVGFGGAAKLLKPLEGGHVLRRKLEEPETLEKLRDESPSELLRLVLESYEEPRTGAEVRRDLIGIVDDKKWNSWWSAARKHKQVLSAPGGRRAYSWAATSGHAHDAVWQAFEAADAQGRLDLLRQNAGRDEELKRRMSERLLADGEAVASENPAAAVEIYFGLERFGQPPGDVTWNPVSLVTSTTNKELTAMLAAVKERIQRERLYTLAREKRPDWSELVPQLIWQESERKALDLLVESLDADAFGSFFDQLLSQPRKSPAAFTWLVERAKDEPSWLERNPIRLLKQLLWSLANEQFAPFKSRLLALIESGGTVPRLLGHLSEDQAEQTGEALQKTPALVDYQREPLLNALYLRFPGLREQEAPLYSTPEMIEEKREELRRLAEEEIPANRRAIEAARELGDLRENFEYKSARQRHEYLSARASTLDDELRRVRPIDPSIVDGTEVVIGSRILFEGEDRQRTITILGPWNSEPEKDILSNESQLAQSILGSKVGQEVELDDGTYRVVKIEPYL